MTSIGYNEKNPKDPIMEKDILEQSKHKQEKETEQIVKIFAQKFNVSIIVAAFRLRSLGVSVPYISNSNI